MLVATPGPVVGRMEWYLCTWLLRMDTWSEFGLREGGKEEGGMMDGKKEVRHHYR